MSTEKIVVLDSVIEFVMEQLAYRVRKFQLKKLVSLLLYGPKLDETGKVVDENIPAQDIEIGSFEKICHKARERLVERVAVTQKDALTDSVAFYESVLANPTVDEKTKIRAQENLDKLYSLVTIRIGFSGNNEDDTVAKAIQDKLKERFGESDTKPN